MNDLSYLDSMLLPPPPLPPPPSSMHALILARQVLYHTATLPPSPRIFEK
jgi:hypothetical protein